MRRLSFIGLAMIALVGCDPKKPVPLDQSVRVEQPVLVKQPTPAAAVDVGGPQGGVHVDDPAAGTRVDIGLGSGIHVNDPAGGTRVDIGGGSGVRVETPESRVGVP